MDAKNQLAELSHAYQHSTILLTACKTGVFAALSRESRQASEVARELKFDPRATEMLLLALAADGILSQSEGGFAVVEAYRPFLLPDGPDTQVNILNHGFRCMQRWARLEETLRSGKPIPREAEGAEAEEELRDFICGMENISRTSSVEVAERVDLSSYRRMLDLGGGPGTSAITFARRNPKLRCVVFDLEDTIAIAREEIEKAGLGDRVETRVADYFQDDFTEGPGDEKFDLVYISNIIHSVSLEETAMFARKAHRAMVPGGSLIIKDFFLEEDRVSPNFAALFAINMLVGTEKGQCYTLSETRALLTGAGFGDFETVEVAMASRLLIARKVQNS